MWQSLQTVNGPPSQASEQDAAQREEEWADAPAVT